MSLAPNPVASIARGDTLTDQAEAALRHALMSGGFAPGQSITIRALSAMLGVSVTPAKDAMTRLIAERVIEWGPRRTAHVPALTVESIHEIWTIRMALECSAAIAAQPAFDEKAITELEAINDKLARALAKADYRNVLIHNRDFHFAIYSRAKLPILLGMIEGLWLRMGPSLNLLYQNLTKREWTRVGTGFHPEIIAALRGRDKKRVREAILADLTHGRERLESAVTAVAENNKSARLTA